MNADVHAENFLEVTERQSLALSPFQSLRWSFGFEDEVRRPGTGP
jgi:hypothetical protein